MVIIIRRRKSENISKTNTKTKKITKNNLPNAVLGVMLGPPKGFLVPSWGRLGNLGAIVGPSWDHLGASKRGPSGHVWATLGPLGPIWEALRFS